MACGWQNSCRPWSCNYLQNAGATTYKNFLQFYAKKACKKHTKEQIYENVWGYDYPADPNNLTSFIRKLRKKIEPEPDRPRYIVTVRGVGYKYTENEEMVGKTATPPE